MPTMQTLCIDEILRGATDAGDLPGVIAGVTSEEGVVYEGAFGRRDLSTAAPMTMDTVLMLASMTKAVTATAAMQLVEAGRLKLDDPVARLVAGLASPMVLEGFAADGSPRLRPARQLITLRHLLTHTSGLGHELWSGDIIRYHAVTGSPNLSTGADASLHIPLLFDPGDRWQYGINLEWVGKVTEAVCGRSLGEYLRDHVTGPLGMLDKVFGIVPAHDGRLAVVHQRESNGSLTPIDMKILPGEYESGGGGLYGTATDYLTFLRMLLNGGRHEGRQILAARTVKLMHSDHLGGHLVRRMETVAPAVSNDFEIFPGMAKKWSLSALINTEPGPDGRSAGSLAWGGLANTYFWLDPTRRIAALFMTQILPFGDLKALAALGSFERAVYAPSA